MDDLRPAQGALDTRSETAENLQEVLAILLVDGEMVAIDPDVDTAVVLDEDRVVG